MATRHPWVDNICQLLERIILGREASKVLDRLGELNGGAELYVLPVWGWAVSRIDVGRKDRIVGSTERLLLPVRLTWAPAPVVLLPAGEPASATFTATGMGHSAVGEVHLDGAASEGELRDGGLEPTADWGPRVRGRTASRAALLQMVEDGKAAYWEVLTLLEAKVAHALDHATSAASADLAVSHERARALDSITLETLQAQMVYGSQDAASDEPSPMQRLVERCTHPGTFTKVDPERYVLTSVRRDARAVVRRALGDPHIGGKVRALAAELGTTDLEAIVAEYRSRYPADRLSTDRAVAALSLRPHPNASTFPLTDSEEFWVAAS